MPQQPPDPTPDSLILARFAGMKNTVTAERLSQEELESAVNVDLDDAGQPHRRRGYRQVAIGKWHSLFQCNDGTVLGVCNNMLGWVRPSYVFVPIVGVTDDHIEFEQIANTVYFTSRSVSGKIVAGTYQPWGQRGGAAIFDSPVVNPSPMLPAIAGKVLRHVPLARFITQYVGRMFFAAGPTVWWTELYKYDIIDATKNFWQFEGVITMLKAVNDGIYVGTDEGCWFISGTTAEPRRTRVMDGAVVPGSAVYIPSELGNPIAIQRKPDQDLQVSVAFMTVHGFCLGQDGGTAINLTEDRMSFPQAVSATALFRRQDGVNQYLTVAESGGTPADAARIGDYIDAEIRRGGGNWITVSEGARLGDSISASYA